MNSTKNIWVALIAVGIIAIASIFVATSGAHSVQPLGATSNQCNGGQCTSYTAVQTSAGYWVGALKVIDSSGIWVGNIASSTGTAVVGTFTQGGGITASSTSASVTMAGTEFTTSNVLDYTANIAGLTLTFMASTSPPCSVMSAGQVRTVYIRNATTTATTQLIIAGGNGTTLKIASTTLIAGNTDGSNMASFEITKKASTNCDLLMTTFN